MLQKTVCDCCEINWDLPISDILRNQNEHKDDSDNKENDQTITQKVCSLSEENQYIDHLKTFACQISEQCYGTFCCCLWNERGTVVQTREKKSVFQNKLLRLH